jgi:hypothetical protein
MGRFPESPAVVCVCWEIALASRDEWDTAIGGRKIPSLWMNRVLGTWQFEASWICPSYLGLKCNRVQR